MGISVVITPVHSTVLSLAVRVYVIDVPVESTAIENLYQLAAA